MLSESACYWRIIVQLSSLVIRKVRLYQFCISYLPSTEYLYSVTRMHETFVVGLLQHHVHSSEILNAYLN